MDDSVPESRRESIGEGGRALSLVEQAVERLRSESLRDDYPTLAVIDDSPIEPQNLVSREFMSEGGPARDVNTLTTEDIGPFIDPQISARFGEATRLSSAESAKVAQSAAANRHVERAGEPVPRVGLESARQEYARRMGVAPSITHRKESQMSRLENLTRILKNLQSESPGIEACALISEDGLIIASVMPPELDDTRVGGMTATLLNLGTRAAVELRRGDVHEVIVRGDEGYAVMVSAGRGVLMLVLANENTKLGLIFFDMREAIKNVNKVL